MRLSGTVLIKFETEKENVMYKKYIKRCLDVVLSVFALIVLGIPLIIVALLVCIDVGRPVIFKQRRIGKDNKEFMLLKFRSMNEKRDENGIYLPDDERITKWGSFIRKTSIDELPSLINIIKGEMSIIGPRPLPVRYLERYTEEQLRRHEVRPGLSNPSTVNGRNEQSWEQQFEQDVWYVDHVSFAVDAKSVIDTIGVVLSQKGSTAGDGSARGEFIGTADVEQLKADADGNFMKL